MAEGTSANSAALGSFTTTPRCFRELSTSRVQLTTPRKPCRHESTFRWLNESIGWRVHTNFLSTRVFHRTGRCRNRGAYPPHGRVSHLAKHVSRTAADS